MNYYIVTGASRGLGEALVRRLLQPGNRVAAVSRQPNEALLREAERRGVRLDWHSYDLGQPEGLDRLIERLFEDVPLAELASVVLINNAGTLQPMAPVNRCAAEEIVRSLHVNLLAPMVLTAGFIRMTAASGADKTVLNVSSGAGRKPYHGWSSYCTSKAGLDMFTRCAGLEQLSEAQGVRVLSVAPGVVDTDMQREIRETEPENFRDQERFIGLKRSGALLSPDDAAAALLRIMQDPRYETGSVLDVRDIR